MAQSKELTCTLSEQQATVVARYLDHEDRKEHSLFFGSVVHNYDDQSEEFTVYIEAPLLNVAERALVKAVEFARALDKVA